MARHKLRTKSEKEHSARTEQSCQKARTKLLKTSPIDKHHEKGYVVRFRIPLSSDSWIDSVFESIEIGQRVGFGWQLGGSILEESEAWSTKFNVSGVAQAHWLLTKTERSLMAALARITNYLGISTVAFLGTWIVLLLLSILASSIADNCQSGFS